jgi:tripartite-type tricarboxylate transporter receptor subunit TctC
MGPAASLWTGRSRLMVKDVKPNRTWYGAEALLVVSCIAVASAAAQDYPNRPVTLMVGLAPGGITDITARIYAEAAAKVLGQRVIVENRAGAGGGVAAAAVQSAAPDGYTLLVFSGSQHATVPAVGNAAYDPVNGFSPITYLFNSVAVLTVPVASPIKSVGELHDWGRKKQGGLTFGTPGLGSPSHLLGAKFCWRTRSPSRRSITGAARL